MQPRFAFNNLSDTPSRNAILRGKRRIGHRAGKFADFFGLLWRQLIAEILDLAPMLLSIAPILRLGFPAQVLGVHAGVMPASA